MISLRRIRAVARKELLHVFRDPRMRPIVFVVPVLQLVILGIAANMDVEDLKTVLVDQDHSAVSRDLAGHIDATTALRLVGTTDREDVAQAAMDRGDAELVVLVPPGTGRALHRGESAALPVWADGTDTNRATLGMTYLDTVLRDVSADHLPPRDPALAAAMPGTPDVRVRVRYNPTLQSRWFMVPGVVGAVLTVLTILLSALAIVKERELGTIEQLSVTPIRPIELILGKLLPFVGIGVIITVLVVVVAVFGFGVPFRGSVWVLTGMVFLYLLSTLGLGLLVSTVSRTQQQAMLSAVLVLLPSFLLGGVFYPVYNMPGWAQVVASVIPLQYFLVMVRAVFLKGAGFDVLWRESLALGAIGVVLTGVAILRFRKRSA